MTCRTKFTIKNIFNRILLMDKEPQKYIHKQVEPIYAGFTNFTRNNKTSVSSQLINSTMFIQN